MRRLLLVLSLVAACSKDKPAAKTDSPKQVEAPVAAKGKTFGAGIKVASATPIDSILAEPKKYAGQTVRIEGMVTDVCPMRGCWMELAGEQPGHKLRFKVTDGEMVFPPDAKGKKAVAEGVVAVHELSLEDTKAYAEEEAREKNEPFDASKITEPKQIVRLDGTGALLVD